MGAHELQQPFTTDADWTGHIRHRLERARSKLSPGTASILAEVADGLFSWIQPNLPEDLCLFRKEGEPWLVSIAHEKDAYMVLPPEESAALTESIPTVSLHQYQEVGS